MSRWLTLAEAAARTGKSEEEIRRAIVMGELRAEPTGDLSSYLVNEADLGIAPAERACCGGRLLRLMLALGVIGAGLMIAVGFAGRTCVMRCPPAISELSDEQLQKQERHWAAEVERLKDPPRAEAQKRLEQVRAEIARRSH